MFQDEWSYSVNPTANWVVEKGRKGSIVANHAPVVQRVERYLQRLPLSGSQRLWIHTQVLTQLQHSDGTQNLFEQAHAALRTALATLAGGNELDARLDLSLDILPREEEGISHSRWLRRQMQPDIHRQSMASGPWNRSLLVRCRKLLRSLSTNTRKRQRRFPVSLHRGEGR